jgi:hypothetical protein
VKGQDWLSERMVFGLLIIAGYIALIGVTIVFGLRGDVLAIVTGGLGTLGAAIGIITQAIWKVDRTERQAAETAAVLASKAPDLSGTGAGGLATRVEVTNDAANPVPTTEAPDADPFRIKP